MASCSEEITEIVFQINTQQPTPWAIRSIGNSNASNWIVSQCWYSFEWALQPLLITKNENTNNYLSTEIVINRFFSYFTCHSACRLDIKNNVYLRVRLQNGFAVDIFGITSKPLKSIELRIANFSDPRQNRWKFPLIYCPINELNDRLLKFTWYSMEFSHNC